jgi:hypothetical protein
MLDFYHPARPSSRSTTLYAQIHAPPPQHVVVVNGGLAEILRPMRVVITDVIQIFSGSQPCKVVKNGRHFWDNFWPHHHSARSLVFLLEITCWHGIIARLSDSPSVLQPLVLEPGHAWPHGHCIFFRWLTTTSRLSSSHMIFPAEWQCLVQHASMRDGGEARGPYLRGFCPRKPSDLLFAKTFTKDSVFFCSIPHPQWTWC